jgi:ATP-dependent Clp protease protease subunit
MAKKKTWFSARALAKRTGEITIFSDIGDYGVTVQDFHRELTALGNLDELRLRISSNGGDVTVGSAIFSILKRNKAHKTVIVEGLAASMASVIAMVGDDILMPKNSQMMIHNPWGGIVGSGEQVISFGEALMGMQKQIVTAYTDRTGLPTAKVQKMMDRETWLTAERAVELGFATQVEEELQMAASFDVRKFKRVPASFGRLTLGVKAMKNKALENTEFETEAKSEADIRSEILAKAKEIRSLCEMAGKPELANGFIDEDKSTSEVIEALQAAKVVDAEAAAKGKGKRPASEEISARHGTETSKGEAKTIDAQAIFDKFNHKKSR